MSGIATFVHNAIEAHSVKECSGGEGQMFPFSIGFQRHPDNTVV